LEADAQNQPIWPELEEIARPAREHRRLAPAARSEIIIRLCARAPLSVRELSILLDRSEAYVGDAIRPLVNSGELTFLHPDQPRHPRQKYLAGGSEIPAAGVLPGLAEPEEALVHARPDPVTVQPGAVGPPSFPNQISNLAIAVLVGVLLGWNGLTGWWAVALGVAALVSWWHVAVESEQFQRFSQLTESAQKARAFLLLKSPITFGEIAVVYLIVRSISGPD
jgi:hypothetical protein